MRVRARAQEFSEWAQCQVLEAVSGYRPSGEQEVYELMNVLDDRLAHSNSAVVMATVKLFLHLTLTMPATHQQARAPPLARHWRCVSLGLGFMVSYAQNPYSIKLFLHHACHAPAGARTLWRAIGDM